MKTKEPTKRERALAYLKSIDPQQTVNWMEDQRLRAAVGVITKEIGGVDEYAESYLLPTKCKAGELARAMGWLGFEELVIDEISDVHGEWPGNVDVSFHFEYELESEAHMWDRIALSEKTSKWDGDELVYDHEQIGKEVMERLAKYKGNQ